MAGPTRLELATSGVTGRRSNQTELRPRVVKRSLIIEQYLSCKQLHIARVNPVVRSQRPIHHQEITEHLERRDLDTLRAGRLVRDARRT